MVDETKMTKAQLLANIDTGWDAFQNYLATLGYEQVTIPTDPAGWTVKDHIAHVAIWEDSLNALLDKQSRREHMGIDDVDAWNNYDWDAVNAVIQQRYHDISMDDLRKLLFGIHTRLIAHIQPLSDADLQRPYKDFEPGSTLENPVIHWLIIDTYPHYDEHKGYIDVIAQKLPVLSKNQLIAEIDKGWEQLNAYLATLTPTQLTQKTDAAGWTVKDHVIHLAIWEDGIFALLERLMRAQYMGIDEATWEHGDNDAINAIIQQRYKDLSWANVQDERQKIHKRLVEKIASLSDEDLQRPYRYYELASMQDRPVINWIIGNTFAHYADHLPWIRAIAES